MNIGMVGLGKLGLPCALAMEAYGGHNIYGYDISSQAKEIINTRKIPYQEAGSQDLLDTSNIHFTNIEEIILKCDIIFIAIQTPHDPRYEGITRIPKERVDFDYRYLQAGVKSLVNEIDKHKKNTIVVIISTVLPGTVDKYIKPLLSKYVQLCYNPFFIAMSTCISDFMNPEFVLLGVDDEKAAETVGSFYKTLHNKPIFKTTVKNAELIKVAYNTFIGMKIVFINTMMEICHKNGCNVDEISRALALGTDRLISNKYLYGGMGDGGGCHPRDNIALSWLARELDLSHDFFEDIMMAREDQTAWLANLIGEQSLKHKLPIVILGKAFKADMNLAIGSPAILLKNILNEKGYWVEIYDPYIDLDFDISKSRKSVFFIGTKHTVFTDYMFPTGSIVIDPWRYISNQKGVEIIRIGENECQN